MPPRHRAYLTACWLLLAVTAAAALFLALSAQWWDAAVLAAFVALGAGFVAAADRLPRVFTLLFLLATLFNTIGYVFDLWHRPLWFDEMAHAFTGFAGSAAIGWLLVVRTDLEESPGGWRLVAAVLVVGLVIGLLWEGFEWAIGIIDSPGDTKWDMVMDGLGALAAGLACAWVARRGRSA